MTRVPTYGLWCPYCYVEHGRHQETYDARFAHLPVPPDTHTTEVRFQLVCKLCGERYDLFKLHRAQREFIDAFDDDKLTAKDALKAIREGVLR